MVTYQSNGWRYLCIWTVYYYFFSKSSWNWGKFMLVWIRGSSTQLKEFLTPTSWSSARLKDAFSTSPPPIQLSFFIYIIYCLELKKNVWWKTKVILRCYIKLTTTVINYSENSPQAGDIHLYAQCTCTHSHTHTPSAFSRPHCRAKRLIASIKKNVRWGGELLVLLKMVMLILHVLRTRTKSWKPNIKPSRPRSSRMWTHNCRSSVNQATPPFLKAQQWSTWSSPTFYFTHTK